MANIGSVLYSVESGMKRYEDTDNNISYIGNWNTANVSSYSGNSRHQCSNSSINPKIKFNFIGDKIYILSSIYPQYSSNIEIKIDNSSESFSESFSNIISGFCVCYIKNNLSFKEHFVEITKLTAGSYFVDFILDSIDLNDNGELKPYNNKIAKYLIKDGSNVCSTDVVQMALR